MEALNKEYYRADASQTQVNTWRDLQLGLLVPRSLPLGARDGINPGQLTVIELISLL